MTFKILTDDTKRVIYRSNIRSAADPDTKNKRLDPLNADIPKMIRSAIERGICDTYSPSSDYGEDFAQGSDAPSPSDAHGESIAVKTVKPESPDHDESYPDTD